MKKSNVAPAIVILIGIPLFGCTNLQVTRLSDKDFVYPNAVIPYALPEKSFLISTTYTLKGCGEHVAAKGELLNLDVTVSVVAENHPDPRHRYYIDYVAQQSRVKDTTFVVETYGNQTLKTFNGTINDQTGAIVTAVASAALKIAAAGIIPLAEVAASPDVCNSETRQALIVIKEAADKKAADEKKAAAKQPTTPASDSDAIKNQAAINQLTFKQVVAWTPSAANLQTTSALLDEAIIRWVSCIGQQRLVAIHEAYPIGLPRPSGADCSGSVKQALQLKQTVLTAQLTVTSWSLPAQTDSSSRDVRQIFDGLVVRNAVPAVLRICKIACPDVTAAAGYGVNDVLATSEEAIPQFGAPFLLPLKNELNQNSILGVSMSEDGVITKINVQSTPTWAANLKEVGGVADTAKGIEDAKKKARTDAMTAAQNATRDANKLVADCLAAQKTIKDNGGTPVGSCQ